jgi:glycosyltransferase involved in cell wall biosynthesis
MSGGERRPIGSSMVLGLRFVRIGRCGRTAVSEGRDPSAETAQQLRQCPRATSLTDDVHQIELEGASELSELRWPPARHVMGRTIERVERVQPRPVVVRDRYEEEPARRDTATRRLCERIDARQVLEQLERADHIETGGILSREGRQICASSFDPRLGEVADSLRVLVDADSPANSSGDLLEEGAVTAADVEQRVAAMEQLLCDGVLPTAVRVVARFRRCQKGIERRVALIVRGEVLEPAPRAVEQRCVRSRCEASAQFGGSGETQLSFELRPDRCVRNRVDHDRRATAAERARVDGKVGCALGHRNGFPVGRLDDSQTRSRPEIALMIRVVHVITGLEPGGAEHQLVNVVTRLDRSRFDPIVISLTGRGPLAEPLEAAGVPVHGLRVADPIAFARLVRLIRRERPDLVETWLYKADLIGGLATAAATRAPMLWSVHQTDLQPERGLRSNVLAARICARLSRWLPTLILCVSPEAADAHAAMGYRAEKIRVVPNGFDTDRFRPDAEARATVRKELGWDESTPIVGLIARFDPQKDHRTFAIAARRIVDEVPEVRLILCGRGITNGNAELIELIRGSGIQDRVAVLGVRDDMPAVTAALDVAVSSSAFGEAFSIAIGEALATGVPCVATDTGNASRLVGDAGRVVPVRNPRAVAGAIIDLLRMSRAERRATGARGRAAIIDRYSLASVVRSYEETYDEILRLASARGRR